VERRWHGFSYGDVNRNAAIEIGVFTYVLYLYCTWVPVYNKQELMCAVKVGFGDIVSWHLLASRHPCSEDFEFVTA